MQNFIRGERELHWRIYNCNSKFNKSAYIFLFFCSIHQINKFQNITVLKIFLFKQIFLFFQYNDHILINKETHLPDLLSSNVSRYVVSQDRLPL